MNEWRPKGQATGLHSRKPTGELRLSYLIVVDTESWVETKLKGKLRLGVAQIWSTKSKRVEKWKHVETFRFKTVEQFEGLLVKYPGSIVIAHNADHDYQVLGLHRYPLCLKRGESIYDTKGMAPFKFTVQVPGGGKVTFIDLMNWFKTSLKNVGEAMGCEKIELPVGDMDETTDESLFTYCERDVEILRRGYFLFWEIAGRYKTNPGISLPSMAMNIYLTKDLPKWRYKSIRSNYNRPKWHSRENEAFIGGKVEAYYKGTPLAGDRLYKFDINSQYPSVMLLPMPISHSIAIPIQDGSVPPVPDDDKCRLYSVWVNIGRGNKYADLGGPGKRHEEDGVKRLYYPVGRYKALLWQEEYRIFREMGFIEKVTLVSVYNSEPILRDFVEYFYEKRLSYKKAGNYAYEAIYKLILNSLYGKFGQKSKSKWKKVKNRRLADTLKRMGDYEKINTVVYEKKTYAIAADGVFEYEPPKDGAAYSSIMSIAGFITSAGRAKLIRAKKEVIDLGGRVYYCDTDSIVCNVYLPDCLVHPTQLGKFKLEEEFDSSELIVRCRKDYNTPKRDRRKGIGWIASDGTCYANKARKARVAYRRRSGEPPAEAGHIIEVIVKEPSGKNMTRIERGDNAWTIPHKFNGDNLLPPPAEIVPLRPHILRVAA